MYLYAPPSAKLVRQLMLDAFVIAWCWAWWVISRAVEGHLRGLAGQARAAGESSRQIQADVTHAADSVGAIPFGDVLRGPFDAVAGAVEPLVTNSAALAVQLDDLATSLGLWGLLVPVLLVVPLWVRHRVRFWRDAAAMARLTAAGGDATLLAMRALMTQPMRRLTRITTDPATAWREGDPAVISRLAQLERRAHGWPRPRRSAAARRDPAG